MRGKTFGILTVMLVLVIVFCIKGTVMGGAKEQGGRNNHYYASLEQEYREKLRDVLDSQGLKNCGVNIRWVADGAESREYTVSLNHQRLGSMTREEIDHLQAILSEAEFDDAACSFSYVIG